MSKKILNSGVLTIKYEIIEENDNKRLELKADKLPDDFYNAYLNLDLGCSENCLGISHDINPQGDWILSSINLK